MNGIYYIKFFPAGREKRIYFYAVLISLLFHLILLILMNEKQIFKIDLSPDIEKIPEEVTVLFPENKPKQIVENINANEEVPDNTDFLSDRNSQAANPEFFNEFANTPYMQGNQPLPDITAPNIAASPYRKNQSKRFSKEALSGEDGVRLSDPGENLAEGSRSVQASASTNQMYNQQKFSADKVGDFALSTYAWEWAPYLNAFKERLYQVWFSPPAYFQLGLIHGYTVIRFSISKSGQLIDLQVLEHKGHESLELSSVNAIKSSFPFRPLPSHFPDDRLTVTAQLIYPNLRQRSP